MVNIIRDLRKDLDFSHKSSQSKTERGEYYTQKNFHEHFLSQKYDVLINNIIFIEITYEKRVQVS